MKPAPFTLRDATPADISAIARLVRDLADYEHLLHEAVATDADFATALFAPHPHAYAMVAVHEGVICGMALWFHNFSTFAGKHGFYIEDVYVDPGSRGLGIGRAFFAALAKRALAEGCVRMDWSVLDWNEPAINFYQKLGATAMSDWTTRRLTGAALTALAAEA